MKSQPLDLKLPLLIGALVVAALLINYFFFTNAAARREANAKEQRETAAAVATKEVTEKQAKEKTEAEAARLQTAKEAEARRVQNEAEAKIRAEEARKKAAEDAEAARKKAIEDAATEHASFLARYLNSGFARKAGVAAIAVAIETEQGTANPTIANALTQRLKTADVQLLNAFFKPEFVADKFVASIFSGDTAIFDRLELTNSLNAVLVGRQTVTYSTNPALENTVTANLRLEVMALPVGLTRENQSWNFAANGIGFRQPEARQAAEERIIEQIAKSTNMVLAPKF